MKHPLIALCVTGFVIFVPIADAAVFSDVSDSHEFIDAITFAKENGITGGFPDNTFRPDRWVNRAEALKMIIAARGNMREAARCNTRELPWKDVPSDAWFAEYVCFSASQKWAKGYDDQTFRPGNWINVGEAAALLTTVYELELVQKEGDEWYGPSIRSVGTKNAIPTSVRAAGERLTRGQFLEMLWRLSQNITGRPAANPDAMLNAKCEWVDEVSVPGVDMQEVNRAWYGWINTERVSRGLSPYVIDKQLMRTAMTWSQKARSDGTITHKRQGQTAYYDYDMMTDWFANNGLSFSSKSGTPFTEAIGWGVFRCGSGDCTQKMIDAVRTTYDFYMSEEGKASRPHFNALMSSFFTNAGVAIVPDAATGKYYLTMHVGRERTDEPDAVCP